MRRSINVISLASTGIGDPSSTHTFCTGSGLLNKWQANSGLTEILWAYLHVEVEGSGCIVQSPVPGLDDHAVLAGGEAAEKPIWKTWARFLGRSTGPAGTLQFY
jgi:Iap family predicted aminopeptidase